MLTDCNRPVRPPPEAYDGLKLPSTAAAKFEAIRLAGAVLRDYTGEGLWRGEPWQIVVNDSPTQTPAGPTSS